MMMENYQCYTIELPCIRAQRDPQMKQERAYNGLVRHQHSSSSSSHVVLTYKQAWALGIHVQTARRASSAQNCDREVPSDNTARGTAVSRFRLVVAFCLALVAHKACVLHADLILASLVVNPNDSDGRITTVRED